MEQIVDLRITLRRLEVPSRKNIFMLRDKKSVVTPHSKIQKSHAALTFLRVRETIAVGIISYCFIYGSLNPAYMLRKHCIRDNV